MVWQAALGAVALSALGAHLKSQAQDEQAYALEEAARRGDKAAQAELAYRQLIFKKLEDAWQTPEFSAENFTPEEISYIGDYMPKLAEFVQEKNPVLIEGLQAEAEKNYQKQALSQLAAETRDKAVNVQDTINAKMELAQMQAAQAEASQRKSLLQELANRGIMGTGQEASILADAQQRQAQGLREAALQSGIESARAQEAAVQQERARKLAAIQGLLSGSTTARQQELSIEEQNANIINSFNDRASQRYQTYLQNQANVQNEANLRNLNAKQAIDAQNVAARNAARAEAVARADRIAQANADNANTRATMMYNANQDILNAKEELRKQRLAEDIRKANLKGESAIADFLLNVPKMGVDLANISNIGNTTQPTTTTPKKVI